MEALHNIPVFRFIRLQLSLQSNIHVSVLQDVGRESLSCKNCGFHLHVSVWRVIDGGEFRRDLPYGLGED